MFAVLCITVFMIKVFTVKILIMTATVIIIFIMTFVTKYKEKNRDTYHTRFLFDKVSDLY